MKNVFLFFCSKNQYSTTNESIKRTVRTRNSRNEVTDGEKSFANSNLCPTNS